MKTIFKYPLVLKEVQTISIPEGAEFLSVREQNDLPVAYFLVDPEQEKFSLEFKVLGTGQPIEDNYLKGFRYLETVSIYEGKLIWHIFSKKHLT